MHKQNGFSNKNEYEMLIFLEFFLKKTLIEEKIPK
ncbi:hypothetical protein U728_2177 [Clostridium botulinum 202F]|nr:hypothetical protein U728_2177 [Clostridium botulinum 202F]